MINTLFLKDNNLVDFLKNWKDKNISVLFYHDNNKILEITFHMNSSNISEISFLDNGEHTFIFNLNEWSEIIEEFSRLKTKNSYFESAMLDAKMKTIMFYQLLSGEYILGPIGFSKFFSFLNIIKSYENFVQSMQILNSII
jgi:hypothetical protein